MHRWWFRTKERTLQVDECPRRWECIVDSMDRNSIPWTALSITAFTITPSKICFLAFSPSSPSWSNRTISASVSCTSSAAPSSDISTSKSWSFSDAFFPGVSFREPLPSVMPRTSHLRLRLSTKPSSILTYSTHISILPLLSLIPRWRSVLAVDGDKWSSSCDAARIYSAGTFGWSWRALVHDGMIDNFMKENNDKPCCYSSNQRPGAFFLCELDIFDPETNVWLESFQRPLKYMELPAYERKIRDGDGCLWDV